MTTPTARPDTDKLDCYFCGEKQTYRCGFSDCPMDKQRIAALRTSLAEAEAKNEHYRRMLFPYADATEISGMSWSGHYLIGDDKSIKKLREIENKSAQIDVYRAAFDENVSALKAKLSEAEARAETARRDALEEVVKEVNRVLLLFEDIDGPRQFAVSAIRALAEKESK